MISLSNEGFQNIDAVDGSLAMLEKLKEKNIYGKVYQAVLGDKDRKVCEEIQDSSYDVAIIMGGFAQSHLPVNSLYQVILFLIVMRNCQFTKNDYILSYFVGIILGGLPVNGFYVQGNH